MQADSVNKLTSVQNVSVWGDSLFILFGCTLMIYKMRKLLKIMNLIILNSDKVGGFEKLVWVPRELKLGLGYPIQGSASAYKDTLVSL